MLLLLRTLAPPLAFGMRGFEAMVATAQQRYAFVDRLGPKLMVQAFSRKMKAN